MDPLTDPVGLWRRTLLIGADGSRVTGGDVHWLQGLTAYVDARGFAGSLQRRQDVFEWHRDVDLEPPGPFPDVGSMRWDGNVLVETGVYEDYVEHWVRDATAVEPCAARFLRSPYGDRGVLLRVGEQFGWAGAGSVAIGVVGGPRWSELGLVVSEDDVTAVGRRWSVERSEGTSMT